MKLSVCIHQFFDQYLPHLKGVSEHTMKAYRDTFTLFLPFAAKRLSIHIASLEVKHLSFDLIVAFLVHLETQRHNIPRTRNLRLAALKSFAKMLRLVFPEQKATAERIMHIPQKRIQKPLIGFLPHEDILKIFRAVDLKNKKGIRDYTILHLLFDTGARASEIAALTLNSFDSQKRTLVILGKANQYRLIELWPKTSQLIDLYIAQYRANPKPRYRHQLFVNQRGQELTRHGIYRLCQKYLSKALLPKRLKGLNPVHSFRHSCAVNMLQSGYCITDIKNRLGHKDIQSTMIYLHIDLSRKKEVQKKFIEYTQSVLSSDNKIDELIDWQNKNKTLAWLDSL